MSITPQRPKGPPLTALRAFEAAARLQSFVAAAEELSVTPGAVSQQIKTLEEWSGLTLFQRGTRGVALSPAGRALLPEFVAAFDALGQATQALRNLRPQTELHIAALPSIAQLWLPQRLGRIRRDWGDVKFSVTAMENPPNLAREMFDLSVFYLPMGADPNGIVVEEDEIFPVCAPHLAAQIDRPDQLNALPLLHDRSWHSDWQLWSDQMGGPIETPAEGAFYSLYSLAVEEAKSGAGVLMGHGALVRAALAAGTLVRPLPGSCPTGRALTICLPAPARCSAEVRRLADLLAKA